MEQSSKRQRMAMKILIADDHGIVRSGLRVLLERQKDIEVVAEAADGAEARDIAIRERPDLAILDVKMPKLTGLQATREIREQAPDVAVLILSMHDDERYLFEALKAGASGYVLKAPGRLGPAGGDPRGRARRAVPHPGRPAGADPGRARRGRRARRTSSPRASRRW